jgi:hypothetical protein
MKSERLLWISAFAVLAVLSTGPSTTKRREKCL